MRLSKTFSYHPQQFAVAGCAAGLALLAVPASTSEGLQNSDDAVCVLIAVLLFGFTTIVALLPVGSSGQYLTFGMFGGAWVLQALALHWIEGVRVEELIGHQGNLAMKLWLVLYWSSILSILAVAIHYVSRDWVRNADA